MSDTPNGAGVGADPSGSADLASHAPEPAETASTVDEVWDAHAEDLASDPAAVPTPKDGDDEPAPEEGEPAPEGETADEHEEELEAKPSEGEEKPEEGKEPNEAKDRPVVEPLLPAELRTVLEELKEHPKLKAAVRNTYYALAAFREVYETAEEARSIKEIVPTVEDAKQLAEKATEKDAVDYAFRADPVGLVHGLARNEPQNLTNLCSALPEALATYAGEDGTQDDRYYRITSHAFFQAGFTRARLKFRDDENMTEAINLVAQAFGVKDANDPGGRPANDPESLRLRAENERFRRAEADRVTQDAQRFDTRLLESYGKALSTEIRGFLKDSFAKGGFTEAAQEKIVQEIADHAWNGVSPWISANVPGMIQRGPRDKALHDRIVSSLLARSKTFIRSQKTGEIVSRWTKDILGSNRKEITTRDSIAARRGPGSGKHVGSGPRRVTAEKPVSEMTPKEKAEYYAKAPTIQDQWAKHGL